MLDLGWKGNGEGTERGHGIREGERKERGTRWEPTTDVHDDGKVRVGDWKRGGWKLEGMENSTGEQGREETE